MRTRKRLLFTLLLLCVLMLVGGGVLALWMAQSRFDPVKSVPLYPGAYNVLNRKISEEWNALSSQRLNFDTWYVADTNEDSLYDFYDQWLLANGWERMSATGGKFSPGEAHVYVLNKAVPRGIKFTGFDGPFFGAPWFHQPVDDVSHALIIIANPSNQPPPGSIDKLPPGSIRVVLTHMVYRTLEP